MLSKGKARDGQLIGSEKSYLCEIGGFQGSWALDMRAFGYSTIPEWLLWTGISLGIIPWTFGG
jgi:hypothetical protein